MQRIAVIGAPAVGKTTFSRKLSELTGLPVVHLDYYFHSNPDGLDEKEAWQSVVKELAKEKTWIIEGNYTSTLDLQVQSATVVIYLNYSRFVSLGRILKRRLQYRTKKRPEMPSNWKEKIEPLFLKYVWTFNQQQRPKIYAALEQFKEGREILIFSNPQDAKDYLASLARKRQSSLIRSATEGS